MSKIAVAGATGRVGRHVVEVLEERGHIAIPMSRSTGVDVVTGDGLEAALAGADCIIDVATTPDQQAATEFFTTAARNLQEVGKRVGVRQIVVVSIIGTDRFAEGYSVAKVVHEQAMLAGPLPVTILRASQFHEFVEQLVEWGRQGDVSHVPVARVQPVAARSVAEALVELAEKPATGATVEIAGPREEDLVELAKLYAADLDDRLTIEAASDPSNPDRHVFEEGGLLPGPGATIAGPTFEDWLRRR